MFAAPAPGAARGHAPRDLFGRLDFAGRRRYHLAGLGLALRGEDLIEADFVEHPSDARQPLVVPFLGSRGQDALRDEDAFVIQWLEERFGHADRVRERLAEAVARV